jgi:predicted GNAT family acetyltransferase
MLVLCKARERIMTVYIRHLASSHRFETTVDGVTCELEYTLQGKVMTITHTGVPSEVGGRGIASELVRAAYEVARQEGWKVVPACSYARVWSERHPEYAGLRA